LVIKSEVGLTDLDLLQVPDLLGVLLDGAVAAELARPQRIQDGHLGPLLLVQVGGVDLLLRLDVGREVGANQVPVVVVVDGGN